VEIKVFERDHSTCTAVNWTLL